MAKFISDADMAAMDPATSGKKSKFISDDEMTKLESSKQPESPKQKGFLPDSVDSIPGWLYENAPIAPGVSFKDAVDRTAPVLQKIGEAVDPYTGAPTRAALSNAISGKSPVQGFKDNFGAKFGTAPSGKQIAQQLGVPDTSLSDVLPSLYSKSGEGLALEKGGLLDPTASGAAGLGLDVATDWTNVVPVGMLAKGAGKLGKAGAKTGLSVAKSAPVVGGVVEGGENIAKTMASSAGKILAPKQAADFPQAAAVAKKHGISPDLLAPSIEFGPDSYISRASRYVAEGPAGEALREAHSKGLNAVGSAIDESVRRSTGGNKPLSLFDAGSAVKDGFDKAKTALLDGADITYNKVQKYAPGLRIDRDAASALASKLDGIEKFAKGRATRGIDDVDRAQGRYLLNAVAAFRRGNGSMKQTVEAMQDIGRKAFGKKLPPGQIPHDIDKMRDLYFAAQDAVIETTRKHISPEFADELVSNNAAISSFMKDAGRFEKVLDLPPEKVIPALAADTSRLNSFKKVVDPATFNQLKGAYVADIIPRAADGSIHFGTFAKAIRGDEDILKAVLSPDELTSLKELSELGAKFGPQVLSTSGTGASAQFMGLIRGIFDGSVTKSSIDIMKSRARGVPVKAAKKAKKAAQMPPKATVEPAGLLKRSMGVRNKAVPQILKGSQSLAPSGLLRGDDEQ